MIDALVAPGGIRVHHIQLSPQVVPVLSPAVVGLQPTINSPVWTSLHIHVGLDSPSRNLPMTASTPVIVNTTTAVHAGLRVKFAYQSSVPVCMLLYIHVGLHSPSRCLPMTASTPLIVSTTIAVHAGLRVQVCIPNTCSSADVVTHLCRYRHNRVGT